MTNQELTEVKKIFKDNSLKLESLDGSYNGIKYAVYRQEGTCYRLDKELGKIVHIQQNR